MRSRRRRIWTETLALFARVDFECSGPARETLATHILAYEGDSHVEWFEGNYTDYEADRKRRLGADADQPTRIKYKRLTR